MLKLEDFKAAKQRVDEVILETHLIHSDAFSAECGNDVYIKPENLQKTGAFKIRGAYNKIVKLDDEAKKACLPRNRHLAANPAFRCSGGWIFVCRRQHFRRSNSKNPVAPSPKCCGILFFWATDFLFLSPSC